LYQQGGRLQYTSGTDAARSLLEFAHGEPLTSDGYGYLGIHVATCYGVRGSFTDRTVWTHENTQAIAAAVADPIGSTFWHGAKEPYRFLAAAHAWVNQSAPVHLPVTADATASAFQHFALLLRDEELGARVNLAPCNVGDVPRDFYTDLAAGTAYSREDINEVAWMVYGKVPRRVAVR
jgi:DNA-directed RNA polymerase